MTVRINIQRLLRSLLVSFIFPLTGVILIDLQFGWFPLVTSGAMVIFVPLATYVVTRAALSEMAQVIQKVAPLEVGSGEVFSEQEASS
ncbi:MAG: hypothetical protein KF832_08270 [Caldilineaceae bacterium]|nr:hypothetical protein [Caldilineaceae bacterium]